MERRYGEKNVAPLAFSLAGTLPLTVECPGPQQIMHFLLDTSVYLVVDICTIQCLGDGSFMATGVLSESLLVMIVLVLHQLVLAAVSIVQDSALKMQDILGILVFSLTFVPKIPVPSELLD